MTPNLEAFDIEAAKRQCKRWLTDYDEYDPEVMRVRTLVNAIAALERERAEHAKALIISDGFEAELRKLRAEHAATIEAACRAQKEAAAVDCDEWAQAAELHVTNTRERNAQVLAYKSAASSIRQLPLSAIVPEEGTCAHEECVLNSAHTPNGVFVTEPRRDGDHFWERRDE